MADQLTSTGLQIDDLETRVGRVKGALRAAISPILDLSPDQPTGQIVSILTEHVQQVVELLQELHSAIDPDQATGAALDALCSITGTYRHAATKGTVELTVTTSGATTIPAGSIAAVSGDPDNQWVTLTDVVAGAAGNYTVTAEASQAGAIQALAGTITVIVTPVSGWTAVTNAADASEGSPEETDTELRLRREIEITQAGSASVESIRAAVSALSDVAEVIVYENPHWYMAAPLPPHSLEVVYWSTLTGSALTALQQTIAETIFEEKAAGVQSYGSTTTTVTDSVGNTHPIGHTLATEHVTTVEVWVTTDSDYVGDAAVKDAIVAWAADNLGIGDEVYRSKITGVVAPLVGVVDVSAVQLDGAAADITIGDREIATIDLSNITVYS